MKTYNQFNQEINEKYGAAILALITINSISRIFRTEEAQKVINDLKKKAKSSPEVAKKYMTKKLKTAVDTIKNNKGKTSAIILYSIYMIIIYYAVIFTDLDNRAIKKLRRDILARTMENGVVYNVGPITKLADKIISKLESTN